jgi:hypothetical protein
MQTETRTFTFFIWLTASFLLEICRFYYKNTIYPRTGWDGLRILIGRRVAIHVNLLYTNFESHHLTLEESHA